LEKEEVPDPEGRRRKRRIKTGSGGQFKKSSKKNRDVCILAETALPQRRGAAFMNGKGFGKQKMLDKDYKKHTQKWVEKAIRTESTEEVRRE